MNTLSLRPAMLADADQVFEWRNAPETRQYFFDSQPLKKTDHLRWFEHSLAMTNRCLLIAELENQPIGVLRYDFENDQAEIDIYLRPGLSGQGLGTRILEAGTEWVSHHLPLIQRLQARVIADNKASARAFEKAGFQEIIKIYQKCLSEGN